MPLGWHISVYRQTGDRTRPATSAAKEGGRIAVWQTGVGGLRWIDDLASDRRARFLGGNGYPSHYTAQAQTLLPRILEGPPLANKVWRRDPGDFVTAKWAGQTVIDKELAAVCAPDEWLLVEVWDES